MQILVRLADLTRQIDAARADMNRDAHYDALVAERDRLMARIPTVPAEMQLCADSKIWAMVFADRYQCGELAPGVLEAWFDAALAGGYQRGRNEGRTEGIIGEREQRGITTQLLVDRLGLVARLLENKQLVNLRLRGETEGAPPMILSELIAEALTTARTTL